MEKKQAQFVNQKGMMKDMDRSKFQPDFIFHGKNIRLDSINGETLMAISNEKGNKKAIINRGIRGTCIGYCVIDKYLVLFTKDDTSGEGHADFIYRIEKDINDFFSVEYIFNGDINFQKSHFIETIGVYENEKVIKVYFVDGINPVRVINISPDSGIDYSENAYKMDI